MVEEPKDYVEELEQSIKRRCACDLFIVGVCIAILVVLLVWAVMP